MAEAHRKWLILGATTERQDVLRSYRFVRNEEQRAASGEALRPNAMNTFVIAQSADFRRFASAA